MQAIFENTRCIKCIVCYVNRLRTKIIVAQSTTIPVVIYIKISVVADTNVTTPGLALVFFIHHCGSIWLSMCYHGAWLLGAACDKSRA